MTNRQLPQHPHIEYLRKEAKQRFALLKQRTSGSRLADAQYWLARDYGFSNWRALKEEVLRRMGIARMAHLPVHNPRRFSRSVSVDEELETDGFFQRGAAAMGIGLIVALAAMAMTLLFAGRAFGQTPPKPDTSPHTVQMVTVADDVQLEVLDWGGSGRPLVFLAGLGSTGHDFDAFAPRFTAGHHVYAITRRGFGASGKPVPDARNYSAGQLGDDVLAVMTALKIERPVLAGHSLAGEELSSIGTRFPDRIAGLVYLDAAYAYAYYAPGNLNPMTVNINITLGELRGKIQQLAPLVSKPQEAVAAIDTMLKTDLPQLQAELRATQKALRAMPPAPPMPGPPPGAQSPSARIISAIIGGVEKFSSVKVPALVIYVSPHAPPPNAPSPAMVEYFKAAETSADGPGLIARYRAGNPSAHVVVIANALHAVHKSNPDDVAREMDSFMAGLN